MRRDAEIDLSGIYRYSLTRCWDEKRGKVVFVLLNPSVADKFIDDNTVKKCIGFAKLWGYGSLEIVNLFAFRAMNPQDLKSANEPIGAENNRYILDAVKSAQLVVVGWGNNCSMWGKHHQNSQRSHQVLALLRDHNPHFLAMTKKGHPKHPLYVEYETKLNCYFTP